MQGHRWLRKIHGRLGFERYDNSFILRSLGSFLRLWRRHTANKYQSTQDRVLFWLRTDYVPQRITGSIKPLSSKTIYNNHSYRSMFGLIGRTSLARIQWIAYPALISLLSLKIHIPKKLNSSFLANHPTTPRDQSDNRLGRSFPPKEPFASVACTTMVVTGGISSRTA
jgi:hypothetical protein